MNIKEKYLGREFFYTGGPLVVAPENDHWIDFWTQECSRCGELADAIEMLGMECRPRERGPDYLGAAREVAGK